MKKTISRKEFLSKYCITNSNKTHKFIYQISFKFSNDIFKSQEWRCLIWQKLQDIEKSLKKTILDVQCELTGIKKP